MTSRQKKTSKEASTTEPSAAETPDPPLSKLSYKYVPLILFVLTMAMFANVLFVPNTIYVGSSSADMPSLLPWRQFAFGPENHGHLPLWNPYLFSGTPFVGDIQSGMFYPPNWLYWILPLDKAANWNDALHIFLAGLWTSLWAHKRGLHPLASLVAGTLLMFGGPYFYKVFAGHQVPLDSMAWVPLILLAVDRLFLKVSLRWALVGSFAVAMQILGGYPQTAFMTGVAVALYSVARLIKSENRLAVIGAILGIYLYGVLLAAVQLLPTYQVTMESTRHSGGIPYAVASSFSFPSENILTLFAPNFFGSPLVPPYWGRCYLWEMSLFIGVTGSILAFYGLIYSGRKISALWGVMVLALFLLALGDNTPLFRVLYNYVPGFNKFRADCKFIVELSVFLTMLAGMGMDTFIKTLRGHRRMAALALILGMGCGVFGAAIFLSAADPTGWWHHLQVTVVNTGESYLNPQAYQDRQVQVITGVNAGRALGIAAATCFAVAGLFFLRKRVALAIPLIAALAVLEVFFFAHGTMATFTDDVRYEPALTHYLSTQTGDYRILQLTKPANLDMSIGAKDIWGYNPSVLGRYAQFIGHTQGLNADDVTMDVPFTRLSPLYRMLRLRFIFSRTANGQNGAQELSNPAPHVLMVSNWSLAHSRDEAYAVMDDPKFDPAKTVVLETTPNPAPVPTDKPGTASVVSSTPDSLTIEATTATPTILLITDPYSKAWHVKALSGSSQQHYEILPANSMLRGIPLSAGTHRLQLDYLPVEYTIGRWVSGIAILAYAGTGFLLYRRRRAVTVIPE